MNWLEALQVMSEGKKVADNKGTQYRIHNGELQYKFQCSSIWFRSGQFINDWIEHEYELVVVEYSLSFIEAMNEVQKGHKVECKCNPDMLTYIDEDGDIIYSTAHGKHYACFEIDEVKSKWRVVEEEG